MLFREIITVGCHSYKEHVNEICMQSVENFNAKSSGTHSNLYASQQRFPGFYVCDPKAANCM
jgi:hypothetical protein